MSEIGQISLKLNQFFSDHNPSYSSEISWKFVNNFLRNAAHKQTHSLFGRENHIAMANVRAALRYLGALG